MGRDPKILLFDIENAPLVTWSWGIHEDPSHSTTFVKEDWYVMCWAAKWLGSKEVMTASLPDHKYNPKHPSDKQILMKLWKLLDQADIVVAHNGRRFDCRKANARFLIHGILPPSPYKIIDTLTIARSSFMFTSNRLGDLGKYLGVGEKIDTGGFKLWKECMLGDLKSWRKMVRYCVGDVKLLEKVYTKLRPYTKSHPDLRVYIERDVCPSCGNKGINYHGYYYTNKKRYRRFQCSRCGTWGRGKKVC